LVVEQMSVQGPWLPPAMLSTLLQAQLLLPVRWSMSVRVYSFGA
jgi:hypothetical protein